MTEEEIRAEAMREEVAALWSDLAEAKRSAIRRNWSMRCDWIVSRIFRFAALGYTVEPETVLDDVRHEYDVVMGLVRNGWAALAADGLAAQEDGD